METVRVPFEGGTVACRVAGEGPPVLFLHNAGNDSHNWDLQLERFAADHRVIGVDMVGFGESDRPPGPYRLERFVRQVGAVADALGADRVDLVGHCVGGAACWSWALANPQRVKHLALFSPATFTAMRAGPYGWLYGAATAGRWMDATAYAVARASTRFGPTRRASVHQQFGHAPHGDRAFLDHVEALYARPDNLRVLHELLLDFTSFEPLDHAASPPGVPVMLAWGTDNKILPFSASEAVRQRLRPAVDLILEGSGHLCMREVPAEVDRALAIFLESR